VAPAGGLGSLPLQRVHQSDILLAVEYLRSGIFAVTGHVHDVSRVMDYLRCCAEYEASGPVLNARRALKAVG
jgi:hypothetical protein